MVLAVNKLGDVIGTELYKRGCNQNADFPRGLWNGDIKEA